MIRTNSGEKSSAVLVTWCTGKNIYKFDKIQQILDSIQVNQAIQLSLNATSHELYESAKFHHYFIGLQNWASCLLALPPQFLSSKKLGYKREFSAPIGGYGDKVR